MEFLPIVVKHNVFTNGKDINPTASPLFFDFLWTG